MIDKAHVGAVIDSAYGYLSSVEKFYIGSLADDSEFELDGSYVIESGKLGDYDITFSGNVPIAGRLTYKNNDFVNGIIQYDDYYVLMYGGRAKVIGVPKNNSDGLYASSLEMDKGRYLYRGGNPNNYIWLDENGDGKRLDSELYRIISYETDGTIRVIRDNSIGSFAWDDEGNRTTYDGDDFCEFGDNRGCNVWGNQFNTNYQGESLDELYNSFHYKYFVNHETGILSSTLSDLKVNKDSNLNVFLNGEWIDNQKNIANDIVEHDFYVGSLKVTDTKLEMEKKEISSYTWRGKIGLVGITDMVESSLNDSCVSVWSNYWHSHSDLQTSTSWPCKQKYGNWLLSRNEWLMTPDYGNFAVYLSSSMGYFNTTYASVKSLAVRPSFFLRDDLTFDGEGTSKNPYVIKNV